MVAVSEPFYGFSIIVEGMMQGVGRTKLPFIFNVGGMWLVRIVGTWICTTWLGMGLVSAWACMIAHNLLLFVLFLFAPPLVQLFSADAAVIALGVTVLRMVAVSEPFYGFSIIVEGMMQGVGNTKKPFVFNIAGMWLVRIVGTMICTQMLGFGLVSAWACMIAHNMLLFALFMASYLRGTWNPLAARARV
jgi:Na+-driven multidrug efflux pump